MEAKIFEEFVDIHISFKYEYAPPVGSWMALHQCLECLKIHEADVVHPPVYLAHINPKDSQLVAI